MCVRLATPYTVVSPSRVFHVVSLGLAAPRLTRVPRLPQEEVSGGSEVRVLAQPCREGGEEHLAEGEGGETLRPGLSPTGLH